MAISMVARLVKSLSDRFQGCIIILSLKIVLDSLWESSLTIYHLEVLWSLAPFWQNCYINLQLFVHGGDLTKRKKNDSWSHKHSRVLQVSCTTCWLSAALRNGDSKVLLRLSVWCMIHSPSKQKVKPFHLSLHSSDTSTILWIRCYVPRIPGTSHFIVINYTLKGSCSHSHWVRHESRIQQWPEIWNSWAAWRGYHASNSLVISPTVYSTSLTNLLCLTTLATAKFRAWP